MGITQDGNSLVITDCTITIDNAFDPSTGTATITITPSGGLGTLPGVVSGDPGLPPIFQAGNVTNLAAGAAATLTPRLLAPGGPGQPSVYALDAGIPVGAQGADTFASMIQGGISGLINEGTLIWDSVLNLFVPTVVVPPSAVTLYASSINSTSGSGAGPRTLSSISFPAQAFAWTPKPASVCTVTGTANTQVNLQAFIGSASGAQVGFVGPAVGVQTVSLVPGSPTGSPSNYARVAAGTAATILLCATQIAGTTDDWSTAAVSTTFQVTAEPVQ